MKLSVIIPCYNEVGTLAKLMQRVMEARYDPKEIIVVDDGSTDGTQELLRNGSIPGVDRVILQGRNQGKGAALRVRDEGEHAVAQAVPKVEDPVRVGPKKTRTEDHVCFICENRPRARGTLLFAFGQAAIDRYRSTWLQMSRCCRPQLE
jgi:hypothetical protein